ncbi:MAG: hypothetical protein P0121_01200 [Nitrospira sp.]|nr:hypothetical protein [Nitrospira sp.]
MQLLIRMKEVPATAQELVETKGPRADRERPFLAGERRLPRRSQQVGQATR